ncbi:MAG: WG repeat-containing protein [Bacteroidales bacterium]|nr:WG repeat-containing protein [Bacteroidales bacterium]
MATKKTVEGIVPFKEENKWGEAKVGFKDLDGNVIIKPKYADWGTADTLIGGLATFVEIKNARHGIINYRAEIIVKDAYDASVYEEGFGIYENLYTLFGAINKEGEELLPCKYTYLEHIGVNCLYFECGESTHGILEVDPIGKTTRVLFDMKEAGYARCSKNRQTNNKHNSYNGLICVEKNSLLGLLSKDGKEVVPCKYESAARCGNTKLWASENGTWYEIDVTDVNNIVIKPRD